MADHVVRVVFEFASKRQHAQVTCRGCGRVVLYPPALAKERFGPLTMLPALEKRLRCSECGAKGARVCGVYREIR